jgi:hypothetical protein
MTDINDTWDDEEDLVPFVRKAPEPVALAAAPPASVVGEPVAWRYRYVGPSLQEPGPWRVREEPAVDEELQPAFYEFVPLYAHPPATSTEREDAKRLVERFDADARIAEIREARDRADPYYGADWAIVRDLLAALDAAKAERMATHIAKLEAALVEERTWHEEQAKSLSKQPPSSGAQWERMQHRERIDAITAALAQEPS